MQSPIAISMGANELAASEHNGADADDGGAEVDVIMTGAKAGASQAGSGTSGSRFGRPRRRRGWPASLCA